MKTMLPLVLLSLLTGVSAPAQEPQAASLKTAYQPHFLVGTALNPREFTDQDSARTQLIAAQFNSITPENALKWELVHPQPGEYDFKSADKYVEFGEKHGMFIIGHTLVWHSQTPDWVFAGDGTNAPSREVLLQRMHEHIQTVVGRYRGRIKGWDVVNEAVAEDGSLRPSPWLKIIGADFIEKAFQFAHEADPQAELYYNDFATENPAKRQGALALIRRLKAAGVRIDGVGIQEHVNLTWPTASQLDDTLTAFEALGVKTMVTELDLDVLPQSGGDGNADVGFRRSASPAANPYTNGLPGEVQKMLADRYAELFGVYLQHPALKRVTLWGVTDGDSWLNFWPLGRRTSYPLLFDRNGAPKPCYDAVLRLAATPAASAPVRATVEAANPGAPISPYLYGQFIEHAGNLIYRGLWSELLDDRKFYYPVAPPPPAAPQTGEPGVGPGRRGPGPGRWNPIGPVESVVMDTNLPFVGEHTPWIKLAGSDPRGIRQTGVHFTKGETYRGRIQLAGDGQADVSINLVWGTNAADTQLLWHGQPDKQYQPYTFNFEARQSGAAQLEIVGAGTGSFHVGAVSLMPASNLSGFQPAAVAALKSLHSGVYRFPGGNFVSAHEWRNAIGDPDRRPPVFDPVWRAVQPNDVGTDEFMTLCQLLEVEPYITVNAGLGDATSAAQYVEYANGDARTPLGQQRAANGHPEPYHVKFWGVGNEMWGISYQYGALKPEQFAFKQNEFARAMRKVDPTIQLISSGAMPDTMTGSKESLNLGTNLIPAWRSPADWSGGLYAHCFDQFDLMSDHFYNFGKTHFSLAKGDQVPNDPNEPVTDWMRRGANHIRIKYEEYQEYQRLFPELVAHPKPLNIDEWAYMGGYYPAYPAHAWVFHEMFRHTDLFHMAAYTFATSLLAREGTNVTLNANALVFKIYRDHFGSLPVAVTGNSPQPKPTEPPGGEQPAVNAGSDTFPLDVVAAWTGDHGALTVAVLNPTDIEQTLHLNLSGATLSGSGTLWQLASRDADGQNPEITSSPVTSIAQVKVPRFSVNIYVLPGK
jgi:alpha-L-arabinofuranosidase